MCYYTNAHKFKALPCICDALDMPCLALKLEWLENPKKLLEMVAELDKSEINRNTDTIRVPIDNKKYINEVFIKHLEQGLKECKSKGIGADIMKNIMKGEKNE